MIQAEGVSKIIEGTEKITDTSIRLASAVNDLGALKVFFAIVMVMGVVLGILVAFVIWNLNRKIIIMSEASSKVLEYFNNLSNRTVGKEEGKSLVRETLDKIISLSKYYTLRIRWENNVEDKDAVTSKISRQVDAMYSEMSVHFSKFICVNKPLSHVIEHQDVESIKVMMENYVYMDRVFFTPSKMSEEYDLYFRGLKISYQEKIEMI